MTHRTISLPSQLSSASKLGFCHIFGAWNNPKTAISGFTTISIPDTEVWMSLRCGGTRQLEMSILYSGLCENKCSGKIIQIPDYNQRLWAKRQCWYQYSKPRISVSQQNIVLYVVVLAIAFLQSNLLVADDYSIGILVACEVQQRMSRKGIALIGITQDEIDNGGRIHKDAFIVSCGDPNQVDSVH